MDIQLIPIYMLKTYTLLLLTQTDKKPKSATQQKDAFFQQSQGLDKHT